MQKNFWLYLTMILCASSIPPIHASSATVGSSNKRSSKKSHKFQRDAWLETRTEAKRRKSTRPTADDRYELQISPSHTVKNSTFPLREKIDIDQGTLHNGRTATKAAAHFDAEGA